MKMLGQHYTTKHKNKEELLCSKCPYKTFADRYLKNHMKTHMEVFYLQFLSWNFCCLPIKELKTKLSDEV